MFYLILIFVIIILIFAPQLWVRHVIKRYSEPIAELPGTGAELAEHLVKKFELDGVGVEETEPDQDHYDPTDKMIRLSPEIYSEKSFSAIAIAAHEFGHALQHHKQYQPLELRSRLAGFAGMAEKIASIILVSLPFIVVLIKVPLFGAIMFLSGFVIMGFPILMHCVTLPVEWDASFNRAMPILFEENYLPESARPIIKQILLAAALTYVAASLNSLLNFYRWMMILRR